MKCAICGKEFELDEQAVVRESWRQAGGLYTIHTIPEIAMAHMECNKREQMLLMSGQIELAVLWPRLVERRAGDADVK